MPKIYGFQKLFSVVARGRLGYPRCYGMAQFGFSFFGDEFVILPFDFFGQAVFGQAIFGDLVQVSGIYRTQKLFGKRINYLQKYYVPFNPQTENQQAQRLKYAAAVSAWQNLTSEQKSLYNERAKGYPYSGYHLFIKEYLLSH